MTAKQSDSYFITCAPGLEPLLHAEVRELKLSKVERQVGGVYFEGSVSDCMRANLHLRTAVRVLRRLARFVAPGAEELYEGAASVAWARWIPEGATIVVAAHTNHSTLDHSLFVEQRVKDAICDVLLEERGERPSVDKDNPDVRIHVHLFKDRCTLLVDTSGESLHKRGWRRFQGRAPLAETLAAAVVMLSGWDRRSPLLDPFCGSGTLLVEAALMATHHAPGLFRERFAFELLPGFDAALWRKHQESARAAIRPLGKTRLVGQELDRETLEGARENLASAGLDQVVQLEVGDASRISLRRGWNAWIVTNPPYGERVGEGEDLHELYRAFGTRLLESGAGYHLALLSGDPELTRALGIRGGTRHELKNGALECELLCAEL